MDSRVVQNTETLLECFDRAGIHATFFVLGWVAERFPQLVRDIAARGHEIASHGFHHQLIYLLTPDQFREDVRRAKATIEDAAGCTVRGYRAPSFSIVRDSLWALDVLIEEGHSYDASIFPIRHDRYGIADAPRHAHRIDTPAGSIVEVPSSTVRIGQHNLPIAGGGYFRLLPYAWTRWGMAKLNGAGEPAVFYIHPWEIDVEPAAVAGGPPDGYAALPRPRQDPRPARNPLSTISHSIPYRRCWQRDRLRPFRQRRGWRMPGDLQVSLATPRDQDTWDAVRQRES